MRFIVAECTRSNCGLYNKSVLTWSTKCSFTLSMEGSLVDKIDLQALHFSGTYCHKTGTRPPSCQTPRQPTIYVLADMWENNKLLFYTELKFKFQISKPISWNLCVTGLVFFLRKIKSRCAQHSLNVRTALYGTRSNLSTTSTKKWKKMCNNSRKISRSYNKWTKLVKRAPFCLNLKLFPKLFK